MKTNIPSIILGAIAFFSPWAAYTQLGLGLTPVTIPAVIIIIYGVILLIARREIFKPNAIDISVAVILVIAGISYFWSLSPNSWPLQYFYYLLCYLTLQSTRHFVISNKAWSIIVIALIFGSLVGVYLIAPVSSDWGGTLDRQTIAGLNNNYVAYVLTGAISLSLIYGYKNIRSATSWVLVLSFVVLVMYKIILLETRGAMISTFLIIAWFVLFRYLGRMNIIIIFWSALILIFAISFGLVDNLLLAFEAASGIRESGDLSGRLVIWPNARQFISENPFLGIGVGAFTSVSNLEIGAHNVILTMMLELGFVGFIFFGLIIYRTISPGLQKGATARSRFAAGAFICYWVPIAISGHWELAIISWLIVGLHALAIDDGSKVNKILN